METVIQAIYEEGLFKLPHPLALHEGQKVELIVKVLDNVEHDPAFNLSSLAVETGISDLATEHDHYLYGVPKCGVQNGS